MTSSVMTPHEAPEFDEFSMQQNLLLSDNLKDLKNLRAQLYSAAEYFELSYTIDEQKDIVAATLKDYAIKALVNTVDHLGSITYKANDLLDQKVDEVSGTELRVSCVEQRLRMCQEYIDHEGRSQQCLVLNTPKYHKRYILPADDNISDANDTQTLNQGCSFDNENDWHQFKNAVRSTIREKPTSSVRKESYPSPSQRSTRQNFSFTLPTLQKETDKRTDSPRRFPLLRTGSVSSWPTTPRTSRPTTPNKSRPTTPNPSAERQRYPSELQKSASTRFPIHTELGKDTERYPSKGKRLLKALLSRRKSRRDDMLYTYLDEY